MNDNNDLTEEEVDVARFEKYRIDEEKEAMYNDKMRTLLGQSIDLKEAAERGEDDCVQETANIIRQADEVLKKAKCSSTAYLDAQILHTSSLIYKNVVEKMDSRLSEFKAKEYAENILRYLTNKATNNNLWAVLEEETKLVCNNTGGWTWQLGAIDIEEETAKAPKRRLKRDLVLDAPMKNPQKVKNLEKEEEDLEQHMSTIMNILCKWENANKEPLQYWNLVLNPTSFAETVENIFHVSHLVKEGLVCLALDREGLPIIKTMRKEKKGAGDSDNFPVAVTIDMKEWEDLIEAFEIEESMIPTRNPK